LTTSYPHYLQVSGWNALLPPRQAKQSLVSDLEVDVAIIGAGYPCFIWSCELDAAGALAFNWFSPDPCT
jgi:hypothetical protein